VLEAALQELANGFDGVVGIAAWHLEEDVHAAYNGGEPFPMASVYKVPIAYAVMLEVAEGRLALDDSIPVTPSDYAPGSSALALAGGRDGGRFAVREIMRLSITESDNTASDVLLRLIGGGDEVTRRMRALGIEGLRVDRSVRRFISEWRGVGDVPDEWSLPAYEARAAKVPAEERARAARAFEQDPRDTATPEALAALLAAIHRGDGLTPALRDELVEIMRGSVTGPDRIRAGVPAGTPVAHKTGTLDRATHDAGIVALPGGRGHVALVVLIKEAEAEVPRREALIAQASRAAWARFAEGSEAPLQAGGP
jgi:beta-lactamase class A